MDKKKIHKNNWKLKTKNQIKGTRALAQTNHSHNDYTPFLQKKYSYKKISLTTHSFQAATLASSATSLTAAVKISNACREYYPSIAAKNH